MKNILTVIFLSILLASCSNTPKNQDNADPDSFTFVFMTDIHVKPELRATEGFQMAIDNVNELKPDFVITGGDLVDDALNASFDRADSLYKLYEEMTKGFNMPVYNSIGNHEHYGYNATPEVDPEHPEYGDKMFEKRIGKRYYSFDHKGWHFMILDGTVEGENGRPYIGKDLLLNSRARIVIPTWPVRTAADVALVTDIIIFINNGCSCPPPKWRQTTAIKRGIIVGVVAGCTLHLVFAV